MLKKILRFGKGFDNIMQEPGSDLYKKIIYILNGINALKNQTDVEKALIKEINNKLTNLLASRTSTYVIKTSTSQYTYDTSNEDKTELKKQIASLNQRIAELEDENKIHIEKNELLKTALLLHIDTETAEVHDIGLPPTSIPLPTTPKKAEQNVITIEDAMKAQQAETQHFPIPTPKVEKPPAPESRDVAFPIPTNEQAAHINTSEESLKCAICGNAMKDLISELYDEMGIKYKCGKCGYIWS